MFEPFALGPSLVFPAGGYTFTTTELDYASDDSRRLGVDIEGTAGGLLICLRLKSPAGTAGLRR